jgi:hypothetical protein
MQRDIKPGQLYKHYKGDTYKILALAKHTETEELLVVYERQTDITHTGWRIWVRPASMFGDIIDSPQFKGPRFEYLGG